MEDVTRNVSVNDFVTQVHKALGIGAGQMGGGGARKAQNCMTSSINDAKPWAIDCHAPKCRDSHDKIRQHGLFYL